jgi:micrococcal nuclease
LLLLLGLVAVGLRVFHPVLPAGQARLQRVVDGDTLKVDYQGRSERIRLIGIDAPESADNLKAHRDAGRSGRDMQTIILQGRQAKAFVFSVVQPGDLFRLEFDVEKRDRYGRLLAYVYLPDGRMLNDLIVRRGFALTLTIPPNVKYQKKFLESLRKAREEHTGLWK